MKFIDPNAKNLTAKIVKIQRMGVVEVKFNATLNLSKGIEYFKNNTSLKILAGSDRDKLDNFNSSSISFTWEITSFTS